MQTCANFKEKWPEVSKTALVKTGLDAAALRFKPDLPWGGVFADAMLKIYITSVGVSVFRLVAEGLFTENRAGLAYVLKTWRSRASLMRGSTAAGSCLSNLLKLTWCCL